MTVDNQPPTPPGSDSSALVLTPPAPVAPVTTAQATAAVKREAARVGEPESALWAREARLLVPNRDLFRIERRLNDGHQSRMVLLNRHRLFELVFE